MKGIPKPIVALGIVAIGMIAAYILQGTSSRSEPSLEHMGLPRSDEAERTLSVANDSPVEVLLPFIDTGEREIDGALVSLYARLLDELDARCAQDRTLISDQSVQATRMIEDDRGLDVSNARFLREWLDAVNVLPQDPERDCAPIAATLAAAIRE